MNKNQELSKRYKKLKLLEKGCGFENIYHFKCGKTKFPKNWIDKRFKYKKVYFCSTCKIKMSKLKKEIELIKI